MSLFTASKREQLIHVLRDTPQANTIAPINAVLRGSFPEVALISKITDGKIERFMISAFDAKAIDIKADVFTISFFEENVPAFVLKGKKKGSLMSPLEKTEFLTTLHTKQKAELEQGILALRSLSYYDESIRYGDLFHALSRLAFCNHNIARVMEDSPDGLMCSLVRFSASQLADMNQIDSIMSAYDKVAQSLQAIIYGGPIQRYQSIDATEFMIREHLEALSSLANRAIEIKE